MKVVTAFITFLFSFLLLTGTVAGQSDGSSLPELDSSDLEDFITVDSQEDIDTETIIHNFDNTTRIVDYQFSTENGTRIVFHSRIPKTVEIGDINAFSESGLTEPPIKEYTLTKGYNEVLLDLESKRGDKSIFLNVNGNYQVLSNDRTSALIGKPDTVYGFVLGILGGGIGVITLIYAWIVKRQRKVDKNGVRLN